MSDDKSTSSLSRMLGVLDLFDDSMLTRTAESIAEDMGVSIPTGYRYVRMLVEAGLLQRLENSHYTLGPRIILLDHYIRKADPVLREGLPLMRELVDKTGFDCVTSGMFGNQLLDTHREYGNTPATLAYGRGRPRPMFRGAAPKVILASLPSAQLHKLFDTQVTQRLEAGLPDDWSEFRRYYAGIRKTGFYLSNGELEPHLAALAAPIPKEGGGIWGALQLVFNTSRLGIVDTDRLAELVIDTAQRMAARLN
ncbi:MAG: IclR family transcriptional regulator [Pseudomonadota bacterium]